MTTSGGKMPEEETSPASWTRIIVSTLIAMLISGVVALSIATMVSHYRQNQNQQPPVVHMPCWVLHQGNVELLTISGSKPVFQENIKAGFSCQDGPGTPYRITLVSLDGVPESFYGDYYILTGPLKGGK